MSRRSAAPLLLAAVAALGLLPSAPAQAAARKPKQLAIAILDLQPVGASEETARNLTALVASEVGRYRDLAPVTRREVASLLDYDRQRQLLGCEDDSCLAQVVGALGVEKLLSGQIGEVETSYVLTLHLIDVRSAKVEKRVSRVVPVASARLVDTVKSAVVELIGPHASQQNQPPRLALASELVAAREDTVRLDASRCYDPDGDPLEISWRQLSGPPAPLVGANRPEASFVAREEGTYRFAVQVGDGRAAPQEQSVEVQVLPRRRFSLALGYQTLLSFNRVVEQHEGDMFRNRAPKGGALLVGLKLSDRWMLVGEGSFSTMHVFPEGAEDDAALKSVEFLEPSVLLGASYRFPLDGFDFRVGAAAGASRLYISAENLTGGLERHDTRVRAQCLVGDLSVAVDIPVGERFGLLLKGGLRGRMATEQIATLKNTELRIARDGFLWGANLIGGAYVRL